VRLDPTELARDVGRIVRETFPKDVAFELAVPAEPWSLEADPTQLHQVLVNLCVNARDAMPTGGRLVLRLANEELDAPAAARAGLEPGCYVAITVADTGQGVPLEIQDRIFEPFFTTKEVGRGTGLGLSTTYSIVRGHGGAVTLVSQPGPGATFTVHPPAAEGPALDSRAAESEPPQGSGELVLVVDDEPAIREILVETLTNSGYRVVTACDGSDALAVYDAHQLEVALVLTDISMPGLDGEALIAALRERDPRLPIVASSGLHRAEGLAAPGEVTQFLSKPYATTTLLQAVARARRRGSPDSTAPVGLRRAAGGTADP
jgi:CheY-like chemotaxis protein